MVLTGAGGAFCAGGDVKGMAEGKDSVSRRGARSRQPHPSPAHQPARNRGPPAQDAQANHRRVAGRGRRRGASSGARLRSAHGRRERGDDHRLLRVGFSGDYGGTYFLSQLVGTAKARELYFLSDRIDMKEALRLGLVNWVVPADQLMAKTMEIAQRLASGPRVAYRYMKENLNRAAGGEVDECLDLEATHHVHTGLTEDHKEAARAFVEKREPCSRAGSCAFDSARDFSSDCAKKHARNRTPQNLR